MKKVLCFGELLLRMSPQLHGKWMHDNVMSVYVGGAELNVATALTKWNLPVGYCTALPHNYLATEIVEELAEKKIDTSSIHFGGERIGLYYLPQGADLKHAGVIYDRAYSSFGELTTGVIDWDTVLNDVSWFHFSAISPALSRRAADVCKEALEVAHKKGIFISVDLNYRSKLWQYGEKPVSVMRELAEYCDMVMGNIWAANTLLGIEIDHDIHQKGTKEAYLAHAEKTSRAIEEAFHKCHTVANTFRFDYGEEGIRYYTTLFTNKEQHFSAEYVADTITDKVGSGDCFMAGLIYGLYHKHQPQEVIDFATAAAFGKLSEIGDATNQTIEDVRQKIIHHG